MSLQGIKKGDRVFIVESSRYSNGTADYFEVTGSGPKYVTVDGFGRNRFHRDSGAIVTDYSPSAYAYKTREEWEIENRRKELIRSVSSWFGNWSNIHSLTNEQLAAIREIALPTEE